jgi:hypothetical protein
MEVVSTSDTSVNFYHSTRRNIPEDSHVQHFLRLISISGLSECKSDMTARRWKKQQATVGQTGNETTLRNAGSLRICCNAVPRRQHLLQFSVAGQSKRRAQWPCCCSVTCNTPSMTGGGGRTLAIHTNIDFFNALYIQPTVHKTIYNLQGTV